MRITPASRENAKQFDTAFAITEAVMGFVPNSMLIMARDPALLAVFSELSALIVIRPGRLDPGLKALIIHGKPLRWVSILYRAFGQSCGSSKRRYTQN